MKTELTAEQIERYRRDGVLYFPDFLDASEVAELKAAVLEAIETMGTKKVADGEMEDGEGYHSKVFTQKLNLWRINDTIKRYMLAPELGRMLCELEDVDGYRVWHDQALVKEPFGNPTGWHLDNPYWSFYSRRALSIWIALEEATPYNGCMCFLPGTHKQAGFDNVYIGENLADLFNIYPQMMEVDTLAVPMKPGDCSFHNGLTAHGAGANMTRTRRIAMTCAYMPFGSTFNGQQNILTKSNFDKLKQGDLLEDDQWNPVVYGR